MKPLRRGLTIAAVWLGLAWWPWAAAAQLDLRISEFMAVNNGPLADEDGEYSDWIEIHNPAATSVNLGGWYLTDRTDDLTQWRFPGTNLAANGYLVVFASAKDRRVPGEPLHTNFKLSSSGEYLALVKPDGTNVVSSYTPAFPPQVAGVSYGIPFRQTATSLVSSGALARVRVPLDGSLGNNWTTTAFDDSSWTSVRTGVGYETDGQTPFVPTTMANSVTEFGGTQGANNWFYGYWDKASDADGLYADSEFVAFPNSGGRYGSRNFWNGSRWQWFGDVNILTSLWSDGGFPNGDDGDPTVPTHWAVRRYISEADGNLRISGRIAHTNGWLTLTLSGVYDPNFPPLLYLYLVGTGQYYIDDIKLVAGTNINTGANLVVNGDFESALAPVWTVSPNLAESAITTAEKHSGNASLRIVSTAAGSTRDSAIWQNVAGLNGGQLYTLRYSFLPVTNSSFLVVRFSGNWIFTEPVCGDGITARIFVDGAPVLQWPALLTSSEYSLTVPARVGSRIDFALDPGYINNDFCDTATFTARIETVDPAVVADSIADWSLGGVQGEKNWFYGYYDRSADPDHNYQAANFIPFPRGGGPASPGNFWDGEKWEWFAGEPPFDQIQTYRMRPSGLNSGAEHWVIRRWVSKVSGRLSIDWRLFKEAVTGIDGNGVTARIFHNGVLKDSAVIPGEETLGVLRTAVLPNVQVGDTIDFAVDPTGIDGVNDDTSDRCYFSAIIYGNPTLSSQIASDLQTTMRNVNATAYVRIPFTVADPAALNSLMLRMRYDDGFTAYLNGVQVASANAPLSPSWNSAATSARSDTDANDFQEFNLSTGLGLLRAGANVLAIQGLNASAGDSDFLILPELIATSIDYDLASRRYFSTPTPGGPNGVGNTNLGPLIVSTAHTPKTPADNEDLLITAQVLPTFNALGSVSLIYRVMYSNEVTLPMFDDGQHADGAAGDGVFGAVIPASASRPRQMVRYYVQATDIFANRARFPAFENPDDSPEYLGTVVVDPALTNPEPVLHLFVQNPTLATNYSGTRCSVFYEDEFYDNVAVNLHGQTTAFVFSKKSIDIDLNRGHKLRWNQDAPKLSGFHLLTPAADKAYVRQIMAYETFIQAGVPSHFAFPVRVQQNGSFYGVFHFVERADDEFLERLGLDPNGALYKMYLPLFDPYVGAEKKTRKNEPNDDLLALIEGVNLTGDPLKHYLYDNIDLPEVINFLATIQLVQNEDCCYYKNYYLYRDTVGNGEWQMMPWDLDLTFGRTFHFFQDDSGNTINGYFDTNIYWTNLYYTQIRTNFDFIGAFHPLAEALFRTPDTFDMFLRRWSRVHEQFLQPNNTHPLLLHFERRADELAAFIGSDAALDFGRWGTWSPSQTLPVALEILKTEYFARRRDWIFNTLRYANGGPYLGPQPTNATILFGAIEFNPVSGNQAQEYFQLRNANTYAVDISGWKITGAVDFTFKGGTVIPANGTLYVSPDVKAFRARPSGPTGGQGLFVQGNYQGRLSARGETLQLMDSTGRLVRSTNYTGNATAAQRYLRITEIMYHPAPPPPGVTTNAEEFEFIELKNIGPTALNLIGVHFANGIEFTFNAGGPVTNLAAGQSAVVVRNVAAFVSRYGNGPRIAGQFTGFLENGGENIRLEDASDEKVLDFNYENSWYPITDGLGFSLVIVNENAAWDTWSLKSSWRPSGSVGGSPAASEAAPPPLPPILVNEVLTHTDPPSVDAIELFNPTVNAVNVGGWFITDDFNTPRKFRIPNNTFISAGGYLVFDETQFNTPSNAPTSFAFSSQGDEAYLFSGDANANLTGYFHGFRFGAAENAVSFGRHVLSTGDEHFVAQRANSLGQPNAGPKLGPVVISEIMFHPPDLPGGLDNQDHEFIELRNLAAGTVSLFDPALPANTWRVRGGVSFDFPMGAVLGAAGRLLVVNFNPTDAAKLSSFRARFGVPTSVPIYGPWTGKLDNSADRVELLKPDPPEAGVTPYVLVEAVDYKDSSPWPSGADGTGASLQRRDLSQYGNDPANWAAGAPNPSGDFIEGAAPAITQQPVNQTVLAFNSATFNVTAAGAAPLSYQWRVNGTNITGATAATLVVPNVQLSLDGGAFSVVVFNGAGTTLSSDAVLTVGLGPALFSQPQSRTVFPFNNASFSVNAASLTPLQYQWRLNGATIPGATGNSYSINSVEPGSAGDYTVLVTDSVGTVTSAVARLTVTLHPLFSLEPVSKVIVYQPNASTTFTASAFSTTLVRYQWLFNGAPLAGATASTLTLNNLQLSQAGNYAVVATDDFGSITSSNATLSLIVAGDSDGDGLPDSWEIAYGLNPNNPNDAGIDSDGDTMTNLQEYIAGTNPTNAQSYLKIDRLTVSGGAMLRFVAVSNKTYSIQYKNSLADALWQRLSNVPSRTTNRVETVIDPDLASRRYYRLVTPQQP